MIEDSDNSDGSDVTNLTGPKRKQMAFCRFYLEDFNGTQAAIKAGYSEKTAPQQASRLLRNVKVQKFLAKLQKPALEKLEIEAEKTLRHQASIAYSNILDYLIIDEDGQPHLNMSKCTRDQAAAISKIKIKALAPMRYVENGEEVVCEVLSVELSLWDKNRAGENLMKYQGLTQPDEVDVNVKTAMDSEDQDELVRRVAFMLAKAAHKAEKNN